RAHPAVAERGADLVALVEHAAEQGVGLGLELDQPGTVVGAEQVIGAERLVARRAVRLVTVERGVGRHGLHGGIQRPGRHHRLGSIARDSPGARPSTDTNRNPLPSPTSRWAIAIGSAAGLRLSTAWSAPPRSTETANPGGTGDP